MDKAGSKYGYIMDKPVGNRRSADPIIQLNGYGNMLYSQWKQKIANDLEVVAKDAKNGNLRNVAYQLKPDGIINSMVNLIHDIEEAKPNYLKKSHLEEIGEPMSPADAMVDALSTSQSANPNDQKKIANLERDKNKIQTDMQNLKGKLAKAVTPLQNQISRKETELARKNAELQRIQSKV